MITNLDLFARPGLIIEREDGKYTHTVNGKTEPISRDMALAIVNLELTAGEDRGARGMINKYAIAAKLRAKDKPVHVDDSV